MPAYFEFEVEIKEIKPKVWRRFLLRQPASMYDLHRAIQACGWQECHLWFFGRDYRKQVAVDTRAEEDVDGIPDARDVPVSRLFKKKGDRLLYVYDYGDDWHHDVTYVGKRKMESDAQRILLDGARAFPCEDMGGIPGYERGSQASKGMGIFADPVDRQDLLDWLNGWDPEKFDLQSERVSFGRSRVDESDSESYFG
ncbi:MAG: plasmid pRiA4b ORF-3 family protein [Planctomycetota bacterium]